MTDPHTARVLAAIPSAPETCSRVEIESRTGLTQHIVRRRLTMLLLSGQVVTVNRTRWQSVAPAEVEPMAPAPRREYAFRSVLVPGVAWPYAARAGA